jgi:glucose/arabinose dehydrogenase
MQRATDEAALAALIGTAITENRGRMGDSSLGLQSLDAQGMRDIAAYLLSLPPVAASAPAPTPGLPTGVTQQSNLPANYVACARENSGSCTFSGTVTLAYGVANAGPYRLRSVSGPSFDCRSGNSVFGDPTPGSEKTCFGPSGQVNTIGGGGGGGGSVTIRTTDFATGLSSPWGMAWLPDGRLLVTQKSGSIVLIAADGASRTTLTWGSPRPNIRDGGQGGLLGIAVDPDYASGSPWIYFSYQEPGPNATSGTAVGRAQISGTSLANFQLLLQQSPKVGQDGVHFGSRLAFRADRTLLVSFGDRGQDNPSSPDANNAQNVARSLGKVMRINRDGTIPGDNPAIAGGLPGLFSLGHRNPQGLTVDAATGNIWESEHGPQGGDEINLVQAGRNYGWPLRSYGCPYGSTPGPACQVNGGTHAPLNGVTFTEPLTYWVPTSIAPSNLIVYRGSGFPEWQGNLLMGAMTGQPGVWRVVLNGTSFVSRERVISTLGRVRDISQGPDGWVYVATDDGRIVRLSR